VIRRRRVPDVPGVPAHQTRPLTAERLAARPAALGYRVSTDDDGDIGGVWGQDRFWFLRMGSAREILQISNLEPFGLAVAREDSAGNLRVRGRWRRTLPLEQRADVLLALNDWNRDRIWPKAYLRTEDGRTAVYAEVSVDLGSDMQRNSGWR